MNDKDPASGETRNLYEDMKKPPDRAQRSKYVSAPKQAHQSIANSTSLEPNNPKPGQKGYVKHLVATSPQNRKNYEASCKQVSMIEQFVIPYTQSALKPSISKYQEFLNNQHSQQVNTLS